MRPPAARFLVLLSVAAGITGCGEKDLVDDSLPSDEQVRSVAERFQEAARAGDDDAACDLMSEDLRSQLDQTSGLSQDGEVVELSCGVETSLLGRERELRSLPGAGVFSLNVNRHDEGAEVQLDNGVRFALERTGEYADGEWRIEAIGYRERRDWEEAYPLSVAEPRAAARRIRECLADAGYDAKVLVPEPGDDDAPDAAVAFQRGADRAGGGQVIVYESGVEAVDEIEAVEEAIDGFDGRSVPRGRAGVLFFAEPSESTRESVLDCVR